MTRDLPEELSEPAQNLLARIVPGGFVPPPFRIWAQSIGLAEHVEPLGKYCREESHLTARVREIAVLTAAQRFRSPGAWRSHHPQALAAGLDPASLDRLARGGEPGFTQVDDRIAYRFCSQVLAGAAIDDELFEDTQTAFGADGLVDLLGCLGSFSMSAWALNAYRAGFDEPSPFGQDS